MLRPERMSKVSIAGAKTVMEATIGVLHDLELLHIEDYDERWPEFRTGDPLEQAESASEWLVTIRALESILDLDRGELPPEPIEDRSAATARLEEVRSSVTSLEDDRATHRDEIRSLRDELDRLEPLATLGIDLDLLRGYSSIEVAVGEGPPEEIDRALGASDAVEAYELFTEDGVVAIAVAPTDPEAGAVEDALVGVDFARIEVPAGTGDPAARRAEVERSLRQLEDELERIEARLASIKQEHGGFLLALEAELTVEVDRAEAPLRFATTAHSFIAEGWVPTEQVGSLAAAIADEVGDAVEVDELERMAYEPPHEHGARADGGDDLQLHGAHPPVVQRNPSVVNPFEVFVQTINRPRYHEIDPTVIVFLTFPFAFGFMIGDIGYGLLYMLIGWLVIRHTDSEGMWALGMIAVWAGIFTILFGYLYDDTFGIHMADLGIELPLAGSLSKGLQVVEVAQLWIALSILFGVLHLAIGYVIGFVNDLHHGVSEAFNENGAWLLMLGGLFVWIFSTASAGSRPAWLAGPAELNLGVATWNVADTDFAATAVKPEFLVGTEGVLYRNALFDLGFAGFSETVAVAALAVFFMAWAFAYRGEGFIALIEMPTNAFGHAVSYIRMVAVLLAKGGMAFVVNLIVFGAYETDAGYVVFNLPTVDVTGYEQQFAGLVHTDPLLVTIPLAIFVFVTGHITVLLLGITAAGIQMTRLELVEFFGKFYDGGGEMFQPFGYKRTPTEEY